MPDIDPAAEYLIISTSLRAASLSRVMAEALQKDYEQLGARVRYIDLREYVLPLCDGEAAYAHPHVATLSGWIEAARVVIVATAVYNYDANAAAKNMIELTGDSWENKVVGFLCAAGGMSSYMSIMSLANSLMLDFRCLIIPRFVYATRTEFGPGPAPGDKLAPRIRQLAEVSTQIRHGPL